MNGQSQRAPGQGDRLVALSEHWFRLLQRLYPQDFRDDMGDAVVDTYRDRARAALNHRNGARGQNGHGNSDSSRGDTRGASFGGVMRLAAVWIRAFFDALRNGPLDKHGAGSRILGVDGQVDEAEITRLASFGQDYTLSKADLALDE